MNRIRVMMLAVVVAFVSAGSLELQTIGRAQEQREIPLVIMETSGQEAGEVGDRCQLSLPRLPISGPDHQVIVRNESDTVVYVYTIAPTIRETDNGTKYCGDEFSLTPPVSSFYTIFLDDMRVSTFADEEFPIDTLRTVWVVRDAG